MKSKQNGEIIRIGEASKLLGISRDTLRRWHTEGILKPHTFTREGTGQRYYLRSEIEAFLNRPNGNNKPDGETDAT